MSAVLVERIIGLVALLFVGWIGGILILRNEQIPIVSYFVLACLAGGVAFIILIVILKMGLLSGFLGRLKRIEKLRILTHNLGLIYRNPRALASIFVISLIFQVMAIAALFDALGANGDFAKYAIIGSIVGLAGMLPISINGIGVTESAFVATATQLGMDFNQAVIVAFMLRILVVPLSLACGLIYLVDSHRPRAS